MYCNHYFLNRKMSSNDLYISLYFSTSFKGKDNVCFIFIKLWQSCLSEMSMQPAFISNILQRISSLDVRLSLVFLLHATKMAKNLLMLLIYWPLSAPRPILFTRKSKLEFLYRCLVIHVLLKLKMLQNILEYFEKLQLKIVNWSKVEQVSQFANLSCHFSA